jgi:hypothetical protein
MHTLPAKGYYPYKYYYLLGNTDVLKAECSSRVTSRSFANISRVTITIFTNFFKGHQT